MNAIKAINDRMNDLVALARHYEAQGQSEYYAKELDKVIEEQAGLELALVEICERFELEYDAEEVEA